MSVKQSNSDEGAASLDKYSDNFESDDEKKISKQKRTPTPKKTSGHQGKSRGQRKVSDSSRGRAQGQGLRKGRGNSRRNSQRNSQTSEPVEMRLNHDSFTTRVLSASRNRINELRNKVEELNIKMKELEQENKMYKTLQFRHEKTIRNINDKESDLPMILDKHSNEIRSLREQNRRLREKYEKSDHFLRDAEDELEKVRKQMKKYQKLVEGKELLERDELSRRIAKVELEMEEKGMKIKEFERHIEMLKKNHKHEMGIEIARQKDVKKQLEELKEKNSQLEHQLKEKERALGYQNIHNLRQARSPRSNSPDGSLARRINKKAASMTELTPRDRARFYSDKQRADVRKQIGLKGGKEVRKLQKPDEGKGKMASQRSPPEFSFSSTNKTLEDSEDQRDRKEKQSAVTEDTDGVAKGSQHMQDNVSFTELDKERGQQNLDGSVKHGNSEEKVKKEHLQEQEARKRRERKELKRNDTRERNEKLEHEKKVTEKTEEEKRQEYKEMLESDLVLQAERRKKDDLLKRLEVLDEGNITSTDPLVPATQFKSNRDQARGLEALDELSFTRPTRTVHDKLSHEAVNTLHLDSQNNKWQSLESDTGGYHPSSGPTRGYINNPNSKPPSAFDDDEPVFKISSNSSSHTTIRQSDKKSNLLESLFGPQTNTSKIPSTKKVAEEKDTFSITKTQSTKKVEEETEILFITKSPFSNNQTTRMNPTFPWERNPGPAKTNTSVFDSDKQSVILGGGLVSDNDLSETNGKLPSHQQRQQKSKMFTAKPSVTAIDNFDDEIEEVAL